MRARADLPVFPALSRKPGNTTEIFKDFTVIFQLITVAY
jgi:hypothetical protein